MVKKNTPDNEKKAIVKEFSDKICNVLYEYEDKMPQEAMAALLIHYAKSTLFSSEQAHCYYYIRGLLDEMVHSGIEKIWEDVNPLGLKKKLTKY